MKDTARGAMREQPWQGTARSGPTKDQEPRQANLALPMRWLVDTMCKKLDH
jgi:hypothetical protein